MTRLLLTVSLAVAALSASCTDAHIHIRVSKAAGGATPAPSPTPSAHTTANSSTTNSSRTVDARAALSGQVVGSSIQIANATLTTCTAKTWTFTQPDAPFVSVHFSAFDIFAGDVVTLATPSGANATRVVAPSGAAQFSSARIPGPTAVVSFTPKGCLAAASPLPPTFKLAVDAFEFTYKTAHSSAGEDREICGAANQNKPAVCFQRAANVSSSVYKNARAVTRLLKSSGPSGPQIACTGFLLGSGGHVMTNHHCIKNAAEANTTTFEFMVEAPACDTKACRQLGECVSYGKVESVGADFVFASELYDYAIVKLRGKPGVVSKEYGHLSLRAKAPVKGEPIYVVQHPNGGGKMITMEQDIDKDDDENESDGDDGDGEGDSSEVEMLAATNSTSKTSSKLEQAVVALVNDANALGDFWTSYYADTEGGSSGSPVISLADHTVLALHANGACKNSGAPSHLIIADIKKHKLALPADAFA